MSKIEIVRVIKSNGSICLELELSLFDENGCKYFRLSETTYDAENEDIFGFVSHTFDDDLWEYDIEYMRSKVLEAFYQLRENYRGVGVRESIEFDLLPKENNYPHFSCKQKQNDDFINQSLAEGLTTQSELKQKLVKVHEDSEVMKFFKDNKCSVCLCTYKEILDNDFHIVIPTCGHPLCCECADSILRSEKKECPLCRKIITVDSFNLMKFNDDFQMETQDQNVFL